MSERRLLAVLALLLGLVAGLLLLIEVMRIPRQVTADWFIRVAIRAVLGLAVIIGALIIYGRRYLQGGVLNVAVGLVVLLFFGDASAGILAVISGLLGVFAGEV